MNYIGVVVSRLFPTVSLAVFSELLRSVWSLMPAVVTVTMEVTEWVI